MALRLDSFGLAELAAKPEDAFRLAGLAMAEGSRLPGYGGDYYRLRMGDAQVVVRTGRDRESGQEELLGIDDFCGMVGDETITSDPEELLNFLTEKGHPVLNLEPLM